MKRERCIDCGHVHGGGYCAEVCVKCIEEERAEQRDDASEKMERRHDNEEGE